jgi:hypothetical protein
MMSMTEARRGEARCYPHAESARLSVCRPATAVRWPSRWCGMAYLLLGMVAVPLRMDGWVFVFDVVSF